MTDLDYFLLQESPHIEDYVIGTYLCREEIKNSKEILKISIKKTSLILNMSRSVRAKKVPWPFMDLVRIIVIMHLLNQYLGINIPCIVSTCLFTVMIILPNPVSLQQRIF